MKLGREIDSIVIGQKEGKIIETAEARAAVIFGEFQEKFGIFQDTLAYGQEKQELEVCAAKQAILTVPRGFMKRRKHEYWRETEKG